MDEIAAEFSTHELKEFLEADRLPIQADPEFKKELRDKLWALLEAQRAEAATPTADPLDEDG